MVGSYIANHCGIVVLLCEPWLSQRVWGICR